LTKPKPERHFSGAMDWSIKMKELSSSEISSVGCAGVLNAVVDWVVGKALDYEAENIGAQAQAYGQYYNATGGLAAYGY
jgi:hypothetical protein